MPKSRIPSPARSQGAPVTPRRNRSRSTRSVGSPARSTASGRLSSIVDQFKENNKDSFALSPLSKTVLSDNTDIEMPRRKSWWKKVENSRDVIEVLDNDIPANPTNVLEEFDVEVLSQEKKEYIMDLPESSDSESISSIVVPQRRLFTQKENVPQNKFGQVIGNRESLAKHNKTNVDDEKTANIGIKNLFGQNTKKPKPVFPAALLNISADKTLANKTKEIATEVKGQARNLFGNRLGTKRKNMFADFVVSESEDEIPEIQPKLFAFQKQSDPTRRSSTTSRGLRDPSPTSSITTDIEMDDWKLLPSSTMVEHQLEANLTTPGKRARLSKLSEAKESTVTESTKQSNKSASPKNKSKSLTSPKNDQPDKLVKDASKSPTNDVLKDKVPKKRNSTLNRSKPESSKIKNTSSQTQNNSDVVVEDIKETSNLKNRTRVINKSANTLIATQNVEENQADMVNVMMHHEGEPVDEVDMPEEQIEDEEEIALTYEDNEDEEEHQNHSKTLVPDDNKTKNISSNITQPRDIVVPDQLEKELASIVGEEAENIIQTETPLQEKSIYIQKKVVEETPDTREFTEKLIQNEISNASRKLENEENLEACEINTQQGPPKLTTDDNMKPQDAAEKEDNKAAEPEANETKVSNLEDKEISQFLQEDILESSNEEAKADNEEAQESDQEPEISDQEIDASDEKAEASDQEAEASDQEAEASDQEAEVSDQEGEPSDQEAEASDQEAEVNDQEAEASDQEAEVSDQEAEASDQEADASEERTEAEQELDADEEEEQEQSEQNVETSDNEEIQATDDNMTTDQLEQDKSQNADNENDEQEDDDEEQAADNEEDDEETNNSQEIDNEQNESQEQLDTADNMVKEVEEEDEEINENDEPEQSEEHTNKKDANVTHDTTGRNRKKRDTNSPEAILHEVSHEMKDSFTAKGRNTSNRKTKSILKNFTIRPSLAPPRDSTGFSDGTKNSSAEGSGWDSHRTTRKTLRQTFGKDFTPRKSLRALVMEKSAKRQTAINEANAELKLPQANSTELQEYNRNEEMEYDENVDPNESDHEISRRTRQTTLEMYLQKIKKEHMDRKLKIEEQVRNSLKSNPIRLDVLNFKVPAKPTIRRAMKSSLQNAQKVKRLKPSVIPLEDLPPELSEDMKYKPPKRFRPSNASWITKRLYKFLETKLEPKYDYKARVRAEKLVETLYNFVRDIRRHRVAPPHAVIELKKEMARLDVVSTHFEFYNFFNDYLPVEIKVKVVPDIVNDIPLPREGVFAPILV